MQFAFSQSLLLPIASKRLTQFQPKTVCARASRFCQSRILMGESEVGSVMNLNDNEGGRDWENMWSLGVSRGERFDALVCQPALANMISSGAFTRPDGPAGEALVPGCGRGYEVHALAASGAFFKATGMDISRTGIEEAMKHAKESNADNRAEFVVGDFFESERNAGRFRLVVDYTFLCAIKPEMRKKWAEIMFEVLEDGGELVTLMFPLKKAVEEGGPPHGLSIALYHELLEPVGFKAIESPAILPDDMCHPGRGDGGTAIGRWVKLGK